MPSTRELFKSIIKELNEETLSDPRLPEPDIGDDQPAILAIDVEGTQLAIAHMPGSAQLCLCVRLDPLPVDDLPLMRRILEINQLSALYGGPVLGKDPLSECLMLNATASLYDLDGDRLADRLDALLAAADEWKRGHLPQVEPATAPWPPLQSAPEVHHAS